jgi:hypothetical protein
MKPRHSALQQDMWPRQTVAFRQNDLKRAMKAALDAGMSWARVKAHSDGTFEISAGINALAEQPTTDLDKWMEKRARSA